MLDEKRRSFAISVDDPLGLLTLTLIMIQLRNREVELPRHVAYDGQTEG
jgi:hypothetical protein